MSAPERIWAWEGDGQDGWENAYASTEAVAHGQAEYIRADIHDAAIAAARAEGVREGMLKAVDRIDLAEHDAEERDWRSGANAFAALAKAIRAEDALTKVARLGQEWDADTEARANKAHEKEIAVWSENYAALEQWLADAEARQMRPETTSEHIARDMREGRFPKQSERRMVAVQADLPPEIQVWHSNDKLDHLGTWATTRYPAEAVSYVPKEEIQRNRNEAYDGGWDDGYAEGFGKAMAIALDAFPATTAYGRGAKSTLRTAFEAAIRAAAEAQP